MAGCNPEQHLARRGKGGVGAEPGLGIPHAYYDTSIIDVTHSPRATHRPVSRLNRDGAHFGVVSTRIGLGCEY